ncbi:hypothetical protein FHG87_013684 [Trinorchestia longiramus]|nr:hypothetical protein FHG87_013684 [Trinorchestia longiramus]
MRKDYGTTLKNIPLLYSHLTFPQEARHIPHTAFLSSKAKIQGPPNAKLHIIHFTNNANTRHSSEAPQNRSPDAKPQPPRIIVFRISIAPTGFTPPYRVPQTCIQITMST